MGKPCRLGRVILSAYLYCDVGLDTGSLLVDAHIHFQPVVESVYFRSEGIAFHSLISVLRAGCGCHHCDGSRQ